MSAAPRFVIQRDDRAWYAGRSIEASAIWTEDRDRRHEFTSEREAWTVLQQLQKSGLRVMLYELLGDREADSR